jgi:hypothetical protein
MYQFLCCYFMHIHKNRGRRIALNKSCMYFKDLFPHKVLGSYTKWHPVASILKIAIVTKKKKLRGFGPLANYADRATAGSWRISTNFCG